MRKFPRSIVGAAVALAIAILPAIAQAQRTGLDDMVGARAGQAEGEVQRRGFRNVGGEKGDDRSYAFWWNQERHQCVSIATMNGRYSSVTPATPADCGRGARRDQARPYRSGYHDHRGNGYVAPGELSLVCRNEAAGAFDRRPSEVTANAPIRQRGGYIVQGWYDRRDASKGTRFFTCRFDEDGTFLSVN